MSNVVGAFAISTCRYANSECEHRQEIIPELPKKADRVKGQIYINKKGEKVIWNRNIFHCEHDKQKSHCKECGGSSICEHDKHKSICKECGGSGICEHDKIKSQCKECGGSSICEHGKQKSHCKECGGQVFANTAKENQDVKSVGRSQICEHGKDKLKCKECGVSNLVYVQVMMECKCIPIVITQTSPLDSMYLNNNLPVVIVSDYNELNNISNEQLNICWNNNCEKTLLDNILEKSDKRYWIK